MPPNTLPTVKEVIERAYAKANGEYEVLAESSDDFRTYLNFLNQAVEQWAQTPYVRWQSLYDVNFTLPDTVAEGRFAYPIPNFERLDVANSPLDHVYFVDSEGIVVHKYTMTDQAFFDASEQTDICMLAGSVLYLKSVSSKIEGTSIKLPVYVYPSLYRAGNEIVKIDSVPWLIAMIAATAADASPVPFIARNADKFYTQAERFMKTMRSNNRHKQHLVLKGTTAGSLSRKWEDVMQVMTMKDL